jgi:hypothetical protein
MSPEHQAAMLVLILVSARIMTFFYSMLITPGTIMIYVVNFVFRDSILGDDGTTIIQSRTPKRSQMNALATAILVCACVATVAVEPYDTVRRKSELANAMSLNINITRNAENLHPAAPLSDWVGLSKAFTLIFVGECGDKTFFVAMILSMKYGKFPVYLGSMAALTAMTILAVAVGWILIGVVGAPCSPVTRASSRLLLMHTA